jgi:putative FmdB family regulatory protein
MPLYEYFCMGDKGGCGHEFEEQLSVEDRMIPMNTSCPKCGIENTICRRFTAHLFKGIVNPKGKMDDNFKETMTRIHKEHPDAKSNYF